MAIQITGTQIKGGEIVNSHIGGSASIADSKLATIATANKVSGSAIQLAGSSGLADSSGLKIAAGGVSNAMLGGSIADSKLSTITTGNKVSGSALQLAGTSAIEDSTGIRLKAATAGDGLNMSSQVMAVNVDDSSIETNGDALRIKASGVTNAMLGGSIANSKLSNSTISGIALGSNLNALSVDDSSIEYSSGSAFNGSAASTVRIKALGVTNAMLGGSIAFAKLADSANIARLDQTETVGAVWAFGGNLPTASANPSSDTQLARKAYVDSVAQGLNVLESVRVATTANVNLANELENGDSIDGVALRTNDRVLVKSQSTGSQNGVYIVQASGAASRSSDLAAGDSAAGIFTFVEEGSTLADCGFVCTTNAKDGSGNVSDTVGTHAIAFSQFSQAGVIAAGNGMSKTGTTLNVGGGNGITANANDIAVDLADVPALQFNVGQGNGLEIKIDSNRGLVKDASGIKVDYDNSTVGIIANKLALKDNSVNFAKLGIMPKSEVLTGVNGSTLAFNLASRVSAADINDFKRVVRVYKNGLRMEYKDSPGTNDEYNISDNGSNTVVTFGGNPASGDVIICFRIS